MQNFYDTVHPAQTADSKKKQGKICNFCYLNPEMLLFWFKNLYLQSKFTQKITGDIPNSLIPPNALYSHARVA